MVLESFCGGPLWDPTLLNSTVPDLAVCFQTTILLWLPCAYLWLVAPFYIHYMKQHSREYAPVSTLHRVKSVFSSLLILIPLTNLSKAVYDTVNGTELPPVEFVTPVVLSITAMLTFAIVQMEHLKDVKCSAILSIYWFLSSFFGIVRFRSLILQALDAPITDPISYMTFYLYYALIVVMMILTSLSENTPHHSTKDTDLKPCPEASASFLSWLTFSWYSSLVMQGYKKPLEREDLWELSNCNKASTLYPMFEKEWKKQDNKTNQGIESKDNIQNGKVPSLENKKIYKKVKVEENHTDINHNELKTPTKDGNTECDTTTTMKTTMFKALAKTFGTTFLIGAFINFLDVVMDFINPYLLSLMINFMADKSLYQWQGVLFAVLMFGNSFLQSLLCNQYYHNNNRVYMRVRTVIISAIYRKTLVLTNDARKSSTVGEIVNLMSVDAQRISDVSHYFNWIWVAPLQLVIALYFLWNKLGPSVLAGLGVMVLMIPINAVIVKKQKDLHEKHMKEKDSRIKLMNEILNGIKILKLYAWEKSFMGKVLGIRNKELRVRRSKAYLDATSSFIWDCTPYMVSLVTFAVYVNLSPDNILNAEKAFVSLSLFNILSVSLTVLPPVINGFIMAHVSLKRLQKFFNHEELNTANVIRTNEPGKAVTVKEGVFSWGKDEEPTLSQIDVDIKEGELVAIVGQVGSGKSSILSAFLGDMEKRQGSVNVKGSIAYAPQQAWIQNNSLRDNVVFGKTYDEAQYKNVVNACALGPDIAMLPGGDETEIGEKGINLSGGQKQRVSLARAVYAGSDLYFLDDPLSAVDAHVGKHIFDNVIGPQGLLKNTTRILVTHGIHFLPKVDKIIVLVDGKITETGSFQELLTKNGAFAEFLKNYSSNAKAEKNEDDYPTVMSIDEDSIHQQSEMETTPSGILSGGEEAEQVLRQRKSGDTKSQSKVSSLARQISLEKYLKEEKKKQNPNPEKELCEKGKLVDKENKETGLVKLSVYTSYLKAIGISLSMLVFVMYLGHRIATMSSNFLLSQWSEEPVINGTQGESVHKFYLGVYGAFGLLQGLCVFFGSFVFTMAAVRAATTIHVKLLSNILHCPMAFFDVTPLGRVLNRFTKDIDVIDGHLPHIFRGQLTSVLGAVTGLFAICIGTPKFVVIIVPMAIAYTFIQRLYAATSRELRRLESVSRSPIYSHFSETIAGVNTIKAYGHRQRFIEENESKVDESQIVFYPNVCSHRWVGLRLQFFGDLVIFFAALFAVYSRDTLSAGIVGLCLSYAMQITGTLGGLVHITSELETNTVSVERVKEYSEEKTEAAAIEPDNRPVEGWPQRGQVEFVNYSTRYREGLDLVIKDINLTIKPGEKVGIVGRTGAGKSSLTLALFRLIEAAGGSILIDGVDISKIGLTDLRSRLTIIPQDPVLFAGTLRMNLDPFNNYSDDEVWKSLKLSHLADFVSGLADGLDFDCAEGGENLSVGQRQLICLARALLQKSKILVLDEATAAVDLETDDLIQTTIRSQFADCTMLTIAHRLNTIMDSTKVLVLDKGSIAEFDSPANLLSSEGIFHSMAQNAGLAA
ncbi:multidrug resistance-associated protein 1-like [Glandiceps talaboti]